MTDHDGVSIDVFENRWDKSHSDTPGSLDIELGRESSNPVDQLSAHFPAEVRQAVEGISGDLQLAITFLLIEEGQLAFSELKEKLDVHQQSLTDALDKMQKGSLLTKVDSTDISGRYSSYYEMTTFGERFIESLFESLGREPAAISIGDKKLVKDPSIDGLLFTPFDSVERYGTAGKPVKLVFEGGITNVR